MLFFIYINIKYIIINVNLEFKNYFLINVVIIQNFKNFNKTFNHIKY